MKRGPKPMQCERLPWGLLYRGSAAQLTAAGVVETEHLDAAPARNQYGGRMQIDGRQVRVRRRRGEFDVLVYFSEREDAQAQSQAQAQREAAQAQRTLQTLLSDRDDYRNTMLSLLFSVENAFRAGCALHGFRLDAASAARVAEMIGEVIDAVQEARVEQDPRARATVEQPLRATIARADPALQRLLRGAG
jgi:hypothetical protein